MSVLRFCVFPLTPPFLGICFCPIRTRPVLGHAGPCPAVWPGCGPTEGPSGKAASGEASSQGLFSALILLKKIDTGQSAPAGHTSADGLPLGLCFPRQDTFCHQSPVSTTLQPPIRQRRRSLSSIAPLLGHIPARPALSRARALVATWSPAAHILLVHGGRESSTRLRKQQEENLRKEAEARM